MQHAALDFDWSIAPVTREAFFGESFEKKHLVVHRNTPDYYRDLVSVDDIDRVVTTMGLSVPEVNVVRADATITPADFAYESGFIDAVRVNQLFADGATIIMSNLQERLPTLARFCRALENVFSSRIQTNIYLTLQPIPRAFAPTMTITMYWFCRWKARRNGVSTTIRSSCR